MLISKKNLTYTNLLYVIGKSERPLTSSEIEDETKLSKYVFKMLEKLAPTGNIMRDDRIFVLEEILSKNNDKRFESINNLKKMFDLDWEIEKKDIETKSVKVITRNEEESLGNNVIQITYGDSKKIEIFTTNSITDLIENKNIEDKQLAQISISEGNNIKQIENLFIEKNQQKKPTVYTIKENHNTVNYLDITYDDETQKIISSLENNIILGSSNNGEVIKGISQEDWNIEKERESTINIENLKSDRSKWKYSLNLRGFIRYLNFENPNNRLIKILRSKNHNSKKINKNINLENDRSIIRIRQVLSNPTIKDRFIFLKSWERFKENGFNVIETLLQIANEFQEQLEKYDENYLIVRVTERYFIEINEHFSKYGSFFYPISLSQENKNILNQYRLMILEFLEKELILYTNGISKRIQNIKSAIE